MPNCFKIWSKRFGRVEMQDDSAFFMIGGFDFGVDTQFFSQQIIQAADVGGGSLFGLGTFVLKRRPGCGVRLRAPTSRF